MFYMYMLCFRMLGLQSPSVPRSMLWLSKCNLTSNGVRFRNFTQNACHKSFSHDPLTNLTTAAMDKTDSSSEIESISNPLETRDLEVSVSLLLPNIQVKPFPFSMS